MKYRYADEEQLKRERKRKLLIRGKWRWELIDAVDTISKKTGRDMTALTFLCTDCEGETAKVYDWLFPDYPDKIKSFLESAGKGSWYGPGKDLIAHQLINLEGECMGKTKPASGEFSESNVIAYYISAPESKSEVYVGTSDSYKSQPISASSSVLDDDELPF